MKSSARSILIVQHRITPLYRCLDLATVARTPGAFKYLAHVYQGAYQWWNGRGWKGHHDAIIISDLSWPMHRIF